MGRDEELQHRQTLTEVGLDRTRDDLALRVGHEASHARELTQLEPVASGARVHHAVDRVVLREVVLHLLGDLVGRLRPDLDELLATLVVGDETAVELQLDLSSLRVVALEDLVLVRRHDDIGDGDRRTRARGPVETGLLECVQRSRHLDLRVPLRQIVDDGREHLLVDGLVDVLVVLRQRAIEDRSTQRRTDPQLADETVLVRLDAFGQGGASRRDEVAQAHRDRGADLDLARVEGHAGLGDGREGAHVLVLDRLGIQHL